jgi:RNA polymerase sigma factor (sigma-70 family)
MLKPRNDSSERDPADEDYASLYRYLLSRVRRREDAEDLTQEAYLRLLRVPATHLIERPDAYLFQIATNLLFEFRLRARRSRVTYDSEQASAQGARAEASESASSAEALLVATQLQSAIESLSDKARTVLILHRRDGLTYARIGEQMGISEDMVKKYLSQAIARCRLALGEEP